MLKAILTNMKINSGISYYPEGTGKKEYCIFKACSVKPTRKNVYFTCFCRASGHQMEEVERLKLHEGSLIDIDATMQPYIDKNNNYQVSYEIDTIRISEIATEVKEKPIEKKEDKKREMRKLLNTLSNDPFGKGVKNGIQSR